METIELTKEEVTKLLNYLTEQKWKEVNPLIAMITNKKWKVTDGRETV